MKARTLLLSLLTAILPCIGRSADQGPAAVDTRLGDIAAGLNSTKLTSLNEQALTSPDTFNAILGALQNHIVSPDGKTNAYLQFIKDLNLNFKVFNAASDQGEAALGVSYAYDRSVLGRTLKPDSANPLGLSFAIHAKGNVAFDHNKNPEDFLETGGKFHIFQSIGGWEPMIQQKMVPIPGTNGELQPEAQALIKQLDLNLTEEQRLNDPNWQKFFSFIDSTSRPQFFWDAAGNVSLESNQSFSKKQWAYGGQLGAVFRAWNPSSAWARCNLFDFPFAAIRYLLNADRAWSPSGQAYPSAIVGIDLVDPVSDNTRFAVDPDTSPYPRFRAEVGFKTRVARLIDTDIWLSLGYRHFNEISASSAIRSAHLDATDYFAASINLPYNFNFTYSTGKLPLDHSSDNVFALGWKLTF